MKTLLIGGLIALPVYLIVSTVLFTIVNHLKPNVRERLMPHNDEADEILKSILIFLLIGPGAVIATSLEEPTKKTEDE